MKFSKITFAIFLLVFGLAFINTNAQDEKSSQPKQIKILNNYGEIPFEDGETVIAEVKFIGLDSDYEEYDEAFGRRVPIGEFLRAFKRQKTEINSGEKFHGYKVSKIVKIMKGILFVKGYINNEVIAYGEMLPKNSMNLIFKVEKGMPAFVSEIRFEDNQNFTNIELVGKLKECLSDRWKIFDSSHYEFCLQKDVRSYMFSKGRFQAKIGQANPRLVVNSYIIEIPITEGIRFVYGDIEFKGASVFSEKQLFEMLGAKTGDVANGKYLQDFVFEKLKEEYENRGYVLYDGAIEPEYIEPQAKGLDGIVNLTIDINEGRQFKVQRINFVGVSKEGEIYNQGKFEKGIKKINELIEFAPIDIDQDVETRTMWDESDISILIKTRKLTEDERKNPQEIFRRRN